MGIPSKPKTVVDALKVLSWSPLNRKWLREHDPKGLEQADAALKALGEEPACGWDGLDKEDS